MKRNEVVKNNVEVDLRVLANQIHCVYENYCQGLEAKDIIERRLGSWTPPPLCVKVNFDAAIGRNKASLTVVCRDHMANLLFVWIEIITSADPLIAKARAALLATRKLLEVSLPSVLFEGDSLVVIQAIQGISSAQYWAINSFIKYISSLISSFSFCNFTHVYRELNSLAHALAKWAPV